jgi:RimJ/RimL family protein N-acetyltransferase
MEIPTLQTPRLLLRELREADLDEYARICGDAETMRFLGEGKPLSRSEAWRQLAFLVGHWQLRGFGLWAVVDKATGGFVGRIGFFQPEGWPGFEIGWVVDRQCWGQGIATEAARHLLPLALSTYGENHVISLIHPDNGASIRVAEKIGETLEGQAEVNGNQVHVYGIQLEG